MHETREEWLVKAIESIAESLIKIANPAMVVGDYLHGNVTMPVVVPPVVIPEDDEHE